ncbi:neuronal tyrosine-phosphorylated phosphoinositide-3-kinase adapter 1, partial [Scyliorhinus canicula]|uniref:neuronal tyrosine-phosphorylated phosphoinositide-3-kinase adapter 1 n=1 Tax=Scyliorhinus canicula TaxID=7830 RepID=UPI0018F66337
MSGGLQDAAVATFLQLIEEKGFGVYSTLTTQSCEAGKPVRFLREEMNLLYRKTKTEWKQREEEESKKSVCKDGGLGKVRDLASFRKHFRMGFMTMPASQDHGPHPCASGMTTRSLSLHSVGSVENGDHSCRRKPPNKPHRHPNTKLSLCREGRSNSGDDAPCSKSEKVLQRLGFEGGDAGRRIPPLKPKRSPNTQLSVSFDEASGSRAASVPPGPRYGPPADPEEGEEEEPVYIEMVGDVFKEQSAPADEDSDHSEAIYEEMKYPLAEEGSRQLKWSKFSLSRPRAPGAFSQGGSKALHQTNSKGHPHDIPPPFPNLLLHRPPLLAFPQPASQKAYKAPAMVANQPGSKLPVALHGDPAPTPGHGQPPPRAPKEDGPPQGAVLPSGRARSHSTPLPPQTSSHHRAEKELPTSQTMKALAQSALMAHQGQVSQRAARDAKPVSLNIISSSVKVTAHSLLAQVPGDQKADKELSGLQTMFCSVSRAGVAGMRPLSSLYKMPTAQGLLEHAGPPSMVWPYLPLPCTRPPAYESLKPAAGPKICPVAYHSTVKTQGQDRASGFASVCCSRVVANAEAARASSGEVNVGHSWQRNLSYARKAQEAEGGAPGWSGASDCLDKEEKASGMPVKSQGQDGSSVKGPSRPELPQPCPMACQRSVETSKSWNLQQPFLSLLY